ncbi:hypothetical protein [Lysinibacillus piscis]|uniref:Uncharacterized protein n=1 Tax=Lysinibacillus piscis TaxID=2518931 RepID=A0ABQ5NJQ5_9BACI|nr:hypothetical protein [Lysinibacillus sp. KH24]GLC88599.1 hypothetical protein LYSBPC_17260 [Lysinibacillus sp. KH24]
MCFPNDDSLRRFDMAKNFEWQNESYVLIKTGRIMAHEKQNIFVTIDKENPYYDHLESFYIISVKNLIKNQSMSCAIPIEIIDYTHCIDHIRIDKGKIQYILRNIENNTVALVKYTIDSGEKEVITEKSVIQSYLEWEIEDPWYYSLTCELLPTVGTSPIYNLEDGECSLLLNLKDI